ncbi:Gp15 family bacteriophage protein [Sporolactobacillus laevolacticus]|uniref:Gp15 family bacteriophage protein n=1 Tax=Sporolactobacillus laevolacticus TaxID=33018 RepID=UPI001443061F|nr:Gp15 family bacteriophage protein [Sporolactobacillus laevolacticus]
MSLKQKLDDTITIDGVAYNLDLSFDNVLRWYDLMNDKSIDDIGKVEIAFDMFVVDCETDIKIKLYTVQRIIDEYVVGKQEPNDGSAKPPDQKQYYSFDKDAEFIFASFLQEYGIDLLDQQGIMRWEKFVALLNGMRDKTKFRQIIGIRAAELPTGNDEYSVKERERLQELKQIYALDKNQSVEEQDAAMDGMFKSLVNMAKKGG